MMVVWVWVCVWYGGISLWGPRVGGGHITSLKGEQNLASRPRSISGVRERITYYLPKVLLNTQVGCCLTLVKSLNSDFCRAPIFGSISSISLQQRKYDKIYSVHSKELAESYTLIPVTIFRVAGWGNPNFRY